MEESKKAEMEKKEVGLMDNPVVILNNPRLFGKSQALKEMLDRIREDNREAIIIPSCEYRITWIREPSFFGLSPGEPVPGGELKREDLEEK